MADTKCASCSLLSVCLEENTCEADDYICRNYKGDTMTNWDTNTAFAVMNSLNVAQVAECEAIFNIGDLADHVYTIAEQHAEMNLFFERCESDGFCPHSTYELAWMARDLIEKRFRRVHELLVEESAA